jgi:hypothetical protein
MSNSVYGLSVDAADAGDSPASGPRPSGGKSPRARTPNSPHATRTGPPPRLSFHQALEGKTVKNRLHLDLAPPTGRPKSAGLPIWAPPRSAMSERTAPAGSPLANPEGNEFDLVRG